MKKSYAKVYREAAEKIVNECFSCNAIAKAVGVRYYTSEVTAYADLISPRLDGTICVQDFEEKTSWDDAINHRIMALLMAAEYAETDGED